MIPYLYCFVSLSAYIEHVVNSSGGKECEETSSLLSILDHINPLSPGTIPLSTSLFLPIILNEPN